jgi:hypothetical protein
MIKRVRLIATALVLGVGVGASAGGAGAQGITTGAVTGTVTGQDGQPVEGAQVQVINRATGYSTGTLTRASGLYLVQGLEVGARYAIVVRRIGFEPVTREDLIVTLGQATRQDVQLTPQAVQLGQVVVTATAADISPTRQGVATTVSDSVLGLLPSLSRDFTDFVKLTPQIVQPTTDAPSANGAYNRLNNYTIDGANQNDRFNLGSSEGVPGSASGGRLISMDAVKEFQVLLSPTDVRYGNFAGMLVNAVTKSGTNAYTGGATIVYRAPELAANEDFIRDGDLQVRQYGFHVGGPIVRDRLHFYVAPEWQARSSPAAGQSVDSPSGTPGLIHPDSIEAIRTALAGDFDVGSASVVKNENPLTNIFARIDYQFNQTHRLVLRQLWNRAESDAFSRNNNTFATSPTTQNTGFRLTSNAFKGENRNNSTALQLFSNFANGSYSELIAGYNTISDKRIVPIAAPEINVRVTPVGGTSPTGVVTVGTEQFSPNNILEQDIFELAENYTIPFEAHTITLGGRFEHTKIFNSFAQRSFGVYKFLSIDSLEARLPSAYTIGYDNGGGIPAEFSAQQYSLYAQDQWAFSDRLNINFGLRVDIPRFLDRPPNNDPIESAFAAATTTTGESYAPVRTSDVPETQVLWSPRVGFNWDVTGDQMNQLRGNVGIFTGPPPFILVSNAFSTHGLGLVTLSCPGTLATNQPPLFTTDVAAMPRACLNQTVPAPGSAGTAGVNTTDPEFKYPQNFTMSLGFDRQLPYGVVLTLEGLYRKAVNGIAVRDLNLRGPRIVGDEIYRDSHGRVLYADTINAAGQVTNDNQRVLIDYPGTTVDFTEGVIQVTNQSEDYNYSLSAQIKKRFGDVVDVTAAYTYLQAKDAMSLTSDRAISNWRNGRQFAGLESDFAATTSYFERPHRVLLFGTYTAPWRTTDLSVYYEGMSGTPFTYVANGDLNGDLGTNNDPLYIPRDATDPTEFRIGRGSGAAFVLHPEDAQAFEDFIASHDCLDDQRGKIMERNSCRSPWQNRMDVSLRQTVPYANQRLAVQLDVINFLNLLNDEWGQTELPTQSANFPQQQIVTVRGRTPGPLSSPTSLTNFEFLSSVRDAGAFTKSQTSTSNFYQMQLTLRYSF